MKRNNVGHELKERIYACLSNIPLTLNTHFGDPFQPNQFGNTLEKLQYLKTQDYRGEIEVSTKWILTDAQIEELYDVCPELWITCGITGLNEGRGVSNEERFDHYLRVCAKFPKTILNIRPIIPGYNDSMEVLRPIIQVAARGRKLLKHGGYRDPMSLSNKKTKYDELKEQIHTYCGELGVNDGGRCSVIVSDVTGKVCSTYSESEPSNLDIVSALGFDYEVVSGGIQLTGFDGSGVVTKGDVSFVRLIIESSRIMNNWTDPHEYMQMKGPDGQTMVCTSSWFHWAREVPCMVDCFYCHVRPTNPAVNHFEAGDTGCSPIDLYHHLF